MPRQLLLVCAGTFEAAAFDRKAVVRLRVGALQTNEFGQSMQWE